MREKYESLPLATLRDLAKAREEREEKKKEDQERARLETILSNIDSYDGTSVGQKDIPR